MTSQPPAVAHELDAARPLDLLRLPVVGRFLRWRHARLALQLPLAFVGLIMMLHAFWGPAVAPKNLAPLLTWVHFRGLVVIVLLLAGNLFCMGCPFLLPRDLARRWFRPRWEWPSWLHGKWPAIVLFVLVLFCYELFDLWSSPAWTGAVIMIYFALATIIDGLFQRASFCKHVCPLGQFNFLSSTVSPLEIAVRDRGVCSTCQTEDCIRGRHAGDGTDRSLPVIQRGCELLLFQPKKVGNLDCTFCLDCVHACPHDNIGLIARLPAAELTHSGPRSGVGRIEWRLDYTVLTAVFTFGALLNAFAMISPVYALEQSIASATGLTVEWPILIGMFGVALVLEPALLLGGAALISRRFAAKREGLLSVVNRFARSLIPMGFGVWLAHYGFHFFTGFLTVIPVTQHAVVEAFGVAFLGAPRWQLGGLSEGVVFPIEIGFLCMGLLGSWMVAWAIAREAAPHRPRAAFAPWGILHAALFAGACWIMTQPMDMRGTFLGS